MEIKDIVAGKKYTSKNGEEKTKWTTVGRLFIKDDGKMTVKFEEYINPMAFQNEKGEIWFNVFEQRHENAPKTSQSSASNTPTPQENESERVMADGRSYTEKWRKEVEQKKAMEEAPNEEYFKNGQVIIDDVPF